jgi:hypothetical protein
MAIRVWGVSRLRDLKLCPGMFVSKYETKPKLWVEVPSPQMERGSKVHKTLEDSIKYDLALEKDLASVDMFVTMLVRWKNEGTVVLPEMKFGLRRNFTRCDFFNDPDLRARIGLDVYVKDDRKLLVIDWKTGRYKPEHRQDARFYGAAAWVSTPNAESCTVIYPYIDEPASTFEEVITKPEAIMTAAWGEFDRADEYLDSPGKSGIVRRIDPPLNPGNHCGWCGNMECPNNKNEKARDYLKAQTISLKELF